MEIDSSDEDKKALEFTEFDFVPPAHGQPCRMGLQTAFKRRLWILVHIWDLDLKFAVNTRCLWKFQLNPQACDMIYHLYIFSLTAIIFSSAACSFKNNYLLSCADFTAMLSVGANYLV